MECHAQAAGLLVPYVTPGDTVLDAGCGSGYFYHSIRNRGLRVEYHGIDSTRYMIELGKRYLPRFGLNADNLHTLRIEDLNAQADHVLCLNVLTNIDNYHKPLERLLLAARKTIIIRESCNEVPSCAYVKDRFLDAGVNLKVHVNTYSTAEFVDFIKSYGFVVTIIRDARAQDSSEMVIGYPHYWKFFVGIKKSPQR
jgi:SAM-dependent methyltransferase